MFVTGDHGAGQVFVMPERCQHHAANMQRHQQRHQIGKCLVYPPRPPTTCKATGPASI
jgi:hypothetical protein